MNLEGFLKKLIRKKKRHREIIFKRIGIQKRKKKKSACILITKYVIIIEVYCI
jgi:hypothetical protein